MLSCDTKIVQIRTFDSSSETETVLSIQRSMDPVAVFIGADFHRAMVATAPGEKLLIGRRLCRAPPCEELDPATIFSLFHCELRLIKL